jgi:hypothetical protein
MVSYAEDPNYIHIELMKNRNASEYVRALNETRSIFHQVGQQNIYRLGAVLYR